MRPLPLLAWSVCLLGLLPLACSKPAADDTDVPTTGDDQNIEEANDGIFKSTDAIAFKIEAPIAQLFARFKANQADPPKPKPEAGADAGEEESSGDGKPKFSEPGTLTYGEKKIDIRIQIRGNTSPRDCAFPKYKIEFADKKQTKGTIFQGNKDLRVNSHCGMGGPTDRGGNFGRIQNEISPIREELVYRMIRAAEVPTYRTRIAKIGYTDTSAASPLAAMEAHGLLIESGDLAAKRFAAAGLIDKEKGIYINDPNGQPQNSGADTTKMDDNAIAKVYLAEALASNSDWQFGLGSPGYLWNVDVFGIPKEATQLPIPTDYDLSSTVHAQYDPATNVPSQLSKFRSAFAAKPEVSKAATEHFKSKREAIEKEIAAVEAAGIAAKRLPTTDGKTTTDPGFVFAKKQVEIFFAQPELK